MRFIQALKSQSCFFSRQFILFIVLVSLLSTLTVQSLSANDVSDLFQWFTNIESNGQQTTDMAVGDVDNDGDLDLIVVNTYHYFGDGLNAGLAQNYLYRNDGLGNLADNTKEQIDESNPSSSVELGDLDGDGDLDLLVGNAKTLPGDLDSTRPNDAHNIIYRNDGHGNFTKAFVFAASDDTMDLALADMNSDGELDIVVANRNEQSYLYLNQGRGVFTDTNVIPIGNGDRTTTSIAVGDVNDDGLLDLLMGNFMQPSQLYINEGDETLTLSSHFTPDAAPTLTVAIGNLDEQSGPELVVGNRLAQSVIYYNDGHGDFNAQQPNFFTASNLLANKIALSDLNGDRKLDLVLSSDRLLNDACPTGDICYHNTYYYLNTGQGKFAAAVSVSGSPGIATVVATGDLNNDGLVDIIEGKLGGPTVINFNTGWRLFPKSHTFGQRSDIMWSVAVGDFDGTKGLDIAAQANGSAFLYLNDGGGNFPQATQVDIDGPAVNQVVAGDIDGDYDLDLLMMQRIPTESVQAKVYIYQNDGSARFTRMADVIEIKVDVRTIRLGDLDGDADLDLVVGGGNLNELYLNDGTGKFPVSRSYDTTSGWTMDLALGDVDGDGDLDIAEANQLGGIPSRLYFNDGHANFNERLDLGEGRDDTLAIAFGDIDNDGDLDIIKGNESQQNRIYLNDGNADFSAVRPYGSGGDLTIELVVADLDENGFVDIFDAVYSGFYLNDGTGEFLQHVIPNPDSAAEAVAADMDRDGHLDMVIGDANKGRFSSVWLHGETTSGLVIVQPGQTAPGVGYYSAEILSDPTLAVDYTLYDQDSTPIRAIRACYSVNGGGDWQVAVPMDEAKQQPLPSEIVQPAGGCPYVPAWEALNALPINTSPTGTDYTFTWDVYKSGFFGRSDNVVLRIEALPDLRPTVNGVNSYQRPLIASATQPFRLRGTQIQVVDESGIGVSDALVYQRNQGQTGPGTAIGNEPPYRTDGQGYLQGYGAITAGDELLALAPQPWEPTGELAWAKGLTDTIHLYYTNGVPNANGVKTWIGNPPTSTMVENEGIQVLQVSSANPLLLFDLSVSLEWDASQEVDQTYLNQLRASLYKASEHLYDFTNGQVALGEITVYQNAEEWGYADVVIQAANRLRPYAVQGGIVTTTTVDFEHSNIHYEMGHVRMGATWSRYGEPGEDVGEDWALALAHELSHYFFFLDDTYLGLEDGILIPINTCLGSVMGDMYSPSGENTELLPEADWQEGCAKTLANLILGRSEWETILGRYEMLKLHAPTSYRDNPGPSWMPFALTTIQVPEIETPTATLPDPAFYLDYTDGGFSSSNARGFLIRDNQYAFDVGSPLGGQNKIVVRGAQPEDIFCAFDPARSHFGCTEVTGLNERLALRKDETWKPEIQVRPITSSTLEVQVYNVNTTTLGGALQVRIFPEFGEASSVATLDSANEYTVQFSFTTTSTVQTQIPVPVTLGHVQLWTGDAKTPAQAAMVAFRMGGDVGRWPALRAGGPALRAGGPALRAGGPALRAGGPALRAGGAPIVSPDGQMIFFTEDPEQFEPGEIFTVQSTTLLPDLPANKKLIGLGYHLLAAPGVTGDLPGSISFQYLGVDTLRNGVTEEDEDQLTIYYHANEDNAVWQPLATIRRTEYNLASAASQGIGIYALLAGPQEPQVSVMTPTWSYNDSPTLLTITGSQLLPPLQVQLQGVRDQETKLYAAELQAGNQAVVTLPMSLPVQAYTVTVINGDQSVAVAPRTFAVLQKQPGVCFYDTFDSGNGQWEITGEWDLVVLPNSVGPAMTDSPSGNYRSALPGTGHLTATITSHPFSLADCVDPVLSFNHAYVIATGDGHNDQGVVELSKDGGNTWENLATFQGGGIYQVHTAADGEEWQSTPLEPVQSDSLKGKGEGEVQLRFRLQVDENVADRGWVIDQVVVQPLEGPIPIGVSPAGDNQIFLPVVMR